MSQGAFHPHASGLYVPQELARERQVWTSQERRLMDRIAKMLHSRGVRFVLSCGDVACQGAALERVEQANGFLLRCPHMDRVFLRGA